ncbi:hypothetical protein C7444_11488 [Sphaerotilus hippei]|uniref:DJ-1/PfpI family protein n=1 Tax=Sphaerotilus hippei TaxID=744406 RepID=A0A318GYC6_9BURK|nr:hypothetical protein C7444_11488 [Sphaerotilus hippei]
MVLEAQATLHEACSADVVLVGSGLQTREVADVLDQPFVARGNVATAGGCLASVYLAAWVIARQEGVDAARSAIHDVAPVGEKEEHVERAMRHVMPFLGAPA